MKRSRAITAVALGLASAQLTGTVLGQSSSAGHTPSTYTPSTYTPSAPYAPSWYTPSLPYTPSTYKPSPPSSNGVAPQVGIGAKQIKKPAPTKAPPVCRDDTNPARNKQIRDRIKSGGGNVWESGPGKTRFDTLGQDGVTIVDSALKQAKRQGKTPIFSGGKECKGHGQGSLHTPGRAGDAVDAILKGATPRQNRKYFDAVERDLKQRGISGDRMRIIYNGDKAACSPAKPKDKTKDDDHCKHGHIQVKPAPTPKAKPKSTSGAGETTFVAPKAKSRSK